MTPAGVTDKPSDLSRATVEVLVPPDFTPVYGTGAADGTFTIPNVPVGEYYFVAGTHYFVMSGDTVDLDYFAAGRPDAGFAVGPTNLTLNMTGLDPWQDGDQLEMYSPQSGTLAFAMDAAADSGAPTPTVTSLNGMVYNLFWADRPELISTSDVVTLYQLSKTTDGTRAYNTISRTFTAPPFSLPQNGAATVSGAFTTTTPSQTLTATWDRPAFAAELAAHFPHAEGDTLSTFAISALQGAGEHGYYDEGPDLLYFAPGYTTDTSTVTASWPYADPYPAEWGRILWNRFYRVRLISLPGAQPAAIFAKLLTYRDLSTLATDPMFEPGIGVVINPTINGADALALAPMTGVGQTPTLAWEAPTIGTPAKYYVTVYSVTLAGNTTTLKKVAELETPDTQLAIPPQLLASGQPYVFDIATRATSVDLVQHPYAYALPDAYGSVMTTMATP